MYYSLDPKDKKPSREPCPQTPRPPTSTPVVPSRRQGIPYYPVHNPARPKRK